MRAWARLSARKARTMWMNPPPIARGFRVSRRNNGCIHAVAPNLRRECHRAPAAGPVRAARIEETGHEYDQEVVARPTRGVRCRDAREPTGGHADRATRRSTRCGDTSMHRGGTSAIPGRGGPVAGYAAGGRVQGLHG